LPQSSRVRRLGLVSLVCAAVLSGLVSPAVAAEPVPVESPVVGAFGLGDGLEATISERDGAVEFGLGVGPLSLRWDSRTADDRHGLGRGWGFGFGHVQSDGGVRVVRASGGVYESDPTHPTGLAGYGVRDARFDAGPGTLERRGGAAGPVEYTFTLHELGGVVTYFNGFGDPVVQLGPAGQRTDWLWAAGGSHRLLGMIDPDGVELELDWSDPGHVLVRPGANLPPEPTRDGSESVTPEWRIELDGGRVARIVDPVGRIVAVGYHPSGLVDRIAGASGASTVLTWRAYEDAVMRVASVRTVDHEGRELSARSWAVAGDGTASSGWPRYGGDANVFSSGDPGFRYVTELSDGATRVESEYNSLHALMSRRMFASTAEGEVVIREQSFGYPDGGVPNPRALPGNWSRPVSAELTIRDAAGRDRRASETFEFDDLGRMVARTSVDGTRTATVYDETLPAGRRVPIGLPVEETVTAPDGLVRRTVHALNRERTSVVATEHAEGRSGSALTTVGRVEYDVTADGFVTEQRTFPVGADASPERTRWRKRVDLPAGTLTTVETVAADTVDEASTTTVSSLRHGGELSVTSPVGNEATAAFDAAGRPASQTDQLGRATRATYTADGLPERLDHGDGRTTEPTYDADTRALIRAERTAPGRAAVVTEYRYDRLTGRLLEQFDPADRQSTAITMRYDAFGNPVEIGYPDGAVITHEYDPHGRRTATTDIAGLRTEYAYDVAGVLTRAGDGTTFAYDAANRPISQQMADGGIREFRYWADGSRRAIIEHGASGAVDTTSFYWDGATLLNDAETDTDTGAETDAGAGAGADSDTGDVASYLIGAERHCRTLGEAGRSSTRYLGTDRHGTVVDLTDEAGAVTTRYGYTDYGVRDVAAVDSAEAPDSNPFGYAGEYTNPDGTQHLAIRTYDPDDMRFTTVDPADRHNGYAYVDLNPITGVDPTGRTPGSDLMRNATIVGAVIGLAFSLASLLIAPAAAITKTFTAVLVLGDILSVAAASIRQQYGDGAGIPADTLQQLDRAEIGFAVAAAVGFVFGIGRIMYANAKRSAERASLAAEIVDDAYERVRSRLKDSRFFPDLESKALQLIEDGGQGAAVLTTKHTHWAVRGVIEHLVPLMSWNIRAVDPLAGKLRLVSRSFWHSLAQRLGGLKEIALLVGEWLWAGSKVNRLVDPALRARELASKLGSLPLFSTPPPAGWAFSYELASSLPGLVTKMNTSRPLAAVPIGADAVFQQLYPKPAVAAAAAPPTSWWKRLLGWK